MTQAKPTERSVWKIDRAGRLDRLRRVTEPVGALSPDEVRVRVHAVGLNFADVFALAGLYSATPEGAFIPGLEVCGEVLEVGSAVTEGPTVGDRVMGVTRFGGYVDQLDLLPSRLRRLPEGWSYEQGAAFPVQTLTAWYGLSALGALQSGQRVLVHSAAGGVGLQALAICRKLGAEVIGTVGSESKRAFLHERGYEQVIVRGRDFDGRLREALNGEPLHLVLDAVGGAVQRTSFDALAPTGRLVVFGAAEFAPGKRRPRYLSSLWKYLRRPRYDPLELIPANRSVMAFNLIWLWEEEPLLLRLAGEIEELGLDVPHVGKVFPFADAPAALEHLRGGRSIGKVVLTVGAGY